ncbi:hypothetical protein [Catenovulum sediminis]|uniref:hypothetical protein n=1 Tax=Catenovulum sediminis TaxID=1740262 RepID=UPI00117D9EEC|nr:hypothetical protein [Catenovulum sediminis]
MNLVEEISLFAFWGQPTLVVGFSIFLWIRFYKKLSVLVDSISVWQVIGVGLLIFIYAIIPNISRFRFYFAYHLQDINSGVVEGKIDRLEHVERSTLYYFQTGEILKHQPYSTSCIDGALQLEQDVFYKIVMIRESGSDCILAIYK